MMALIWGLFGSARFWVLLTAGATIVGTLGYFVKSYDNRGNRIVALEKQVGSWKGKYTVAKRSEGQARDTISALNLRLGDRSGSLDRICKAYIQNELSIKPDANKCVGETIDDVLENLTKETVE
jgi:hypothetical protein